MPNLTSSNCFLLEGVYKKTILLKVKMQNRSHTNSNVLIRILKVYRFNPEIDSKPYLVIYPIFTTRIDIYRRGPMLLDDLNYIHLRWHGYKSISHRKSCREGICGSCAMNVNGINTLACIYTPDPSISVFTVYPLPHMPIIRDLVVSLKHFYLQYKSIRPWVQSTKYVTINKIKQSKYDRELLDGLYECILCACCSTSCPSYWWNTDTYLGPAVLLQAYRWLIDSRDENTVQRLRTLNDSFALYRCHTIMNCTQTCPKGLNPAFAISKIKTLIHQFFNSDE
uniref:succinate dehydrogenase n=1 Tax=Eukaryota sp. BB2 TaxID=1949062 RepID=A0A1X8VEX8_9EUKA|nr:succinate:cytochrome c oxidoreductase subunit 2 [Eukaryota sp. BB2]AQL10461.1 succinate:cytochrome c oxidoreductase subunit 2 [Eukaryota sp. BB2]